MCNESYISGWNAAIIEASSLVQNSDIDSDSENWGAIANRDVMLAECIRVLSVKEFREDNQPEESKADIKTALANLSAYIEGGDELGDVSEQDAIAALKLITRKLESNK